MSDILDLIDQAIDDCAVSGDAMRWTPDPVPVDEPYADWACAAWVLNGYRMEDGVRVLENVRLLWTTVT